MVSFGRTPLMLRTAPTFQIGVVPGDQNRKRRRQDMKQLIPGSVYVDQRNLCIVDEHACYLYCNGCGHLKMAHPLKDGSTFQMVRDSAALCTCTQPRKTPNEDILINRILMDLSNAIGKCKTVEDAQRLVWEIASKEEMKP